MNKHSKPGERLCRGPKHGQRLPLTQKEEKEQRARKEERLRYEIPDLKRKVQRQEGYRENCLSKLYDAQNEAEQDALHSELAEIEKEHDDLLYFLQARTAELLQLKLDMLREKPQQEKDLFFEYRKTRDGQPNDMSAFRELARKHLKRAKDDPLDKAHVLKPVEADRIHESKKFTAEDVDLIAERIKQRIKRFKRHSK